LSIVRRDDCPPSLANRPAHPAGLAGGGARSHRRQSDHRDRRLGLDQVGFVAFSWANGEFIPLVPWTLIGSKDEAEQVADLLRKARGRPSMGYATRIPGEVRPWRTGHATDVSAAIERAIEVSAAAPFDSWHNVINICANGIDNVGEGPAAARDRASDQGLIVNGLILGDRKDAAEIATYFRDHVQAGPGSFVMVARAYRDITSAMLAKFLVELAALPAAAQLR
jgi:hypothetical protein